MLENSFIHLPGIGADTEERLWNEGLRSWDELSERVDQIFSGKKALKVAMAIEESRAAVMAREFNYFQGRFKGAEMWRVLPAILKSSPDEIAYLDIETTGLGFPPKCKSTTIAVYYNGQLFLEHDHFRKKALLEEIDQKAKLIVSFNGSTFDLPFLRREFGLKLSQAHVDLRFWLANLGFRGGLKAIQKAFPDLHQRDSMDIDGFDAVRLWSLHKKGVPNALETLLTYNAEDALVLEPLLYEGLELEQQKRPHMTWGVFKAPPLPEIPYQVCPHIYRMLRRGG